MKNVIKVMAIGCLVVNQALAQTTTISADVLQKLVALKTYGNDTIGKYPLCVDVRGVYPYAIDQNAASARIKGNSDVPPTEHEYVASRQSLPNTTMSSPPRNVGACFSDETIVTISFPHQYPNSGYEYTMEKVEDLFDDNNTYDIHVLSNLEEVIPDAPKEFKNPCWAKVDGHTLGELYDIDDSVCTITYGANGENSQTCTPKHRFRVEVCDATGKATGCEWKSVKDINPANMKLITDGNVPVQIKSITTEVVDDWDGGWLLFDFDVFSDMDVHNLTINETGTYYVGKKGSRVLVHNYKP